MIAFLLIVAVIAQDVPTTPTTPTESKGCGTGMYFNINSGEGGQCELINNCETAEGDNLAGCTKCKAGFFNFRGQCYACNCGNNTDATKIECKDNLGCPKCGKGFVMVEKRNSDKSVMYTCQELPTVVPDLTQQGIIFSEYQIHGKDTHEFCKQWGETGCVRCGVNETVDVNNTMGRHYYLNASMCYQNKYCTNYTLNSATGVYTCTGCKQAANQNEQSYYLLEGVCTPCDGNCTKCDVNTGVCNECFPGYYPVNNSSKKCYQCDPNCHIEGCVQLNNTAGLKPGQCTKCRSDSARNETYYLVANKYCIRMPAHCEEAETDRGCTKCKAGYFLVPHHYNGINNFHYKIAGVRLGMCVPHQASCKVNHTTPTGCSACINGYVLDTKKWNHEGKEYSIGICAGASSVFIVALIALLVLLF